ncbi:MAG: Ig-like domain-containing protein, partial [Armatimonadota bacterium]|nr:Ig-like domain-containing protein [Armatimonadota bacterium]
VTFTATVTPVAPGAGTPTGTVTFRDGATVLGTGTLNANRQASITTSSLAVGSHTITATYNGNGNFNGSASPVLTQVVNPPCALNVTSQVRITRGSLIRGGSYFSGIFDSTRFRQVVTIENISGTAITGPVSLVLDNLNGATLYNATGSTSCTSPSGSPFINVDLGDGVLSPNEQATVVLEFSNASSSLSYTARVLAGPRER